jgi:hypothetical protein
MEDSGRGLISVAGRGLLPAQQAHHVFGHHPERTV